MFNFSQNTPNRTKIPEIERITLEIVISISFFIVHLKNWEKKNTEMLEKLFNSGPKNN